MAAPKPTADQIAAERDRLQRELYRLLEVKRQRRLSEMHPDHWRWRQEFDQAREAKMQFDAIWGET